jgi:voltage-gated potassium channel
VAQVYQCIALEASRAQHARDKSEMARRGLGPNVLSRRSLHQQQQHHSSQASTTSSVTHEAGNYFWEELECFDVTMQYYEKARHFFTHNEYGRAFSVLLPFAGLVLIGAIVVGPLEDWNIVESLYFAVVSLTTVGFGDYYPRHVISVWFCILWLPFSVGFMSMFLKNVATFYIRLSAQNINRIERRMRRRVARAKEQLEFERAEALKRAYQYQQNQPAELELQRFPSVDSDDDNPTGNKHASPSSSQNSRHSGNAARGGRRQGPRSQFNALPTAPEDSVATPVVKASRASLFGSPGEDDNVINRRERILQNSLGGNQDDDRPKGQTMDTMKDLLEAVHKSIASGSSNSRYLSMRSSVMKPVLGDSNEPMRKPSFALRALVQERFSEIIATDIAGYQSSIEIKDNTLSVTIDLRETAEKWHIPRRARKAFRAVAFEALYFVGEHGLITKGADALYALSPFEFNGLFSPLLATLGDAGTMEDWLARTQVLAEVDLKNKDSDYRRDGNEELGEKTAYRTTQERLHTARHRTKSDTSNSFQRVTVFENTLDC